MTMGWANNLQKLCNSIWEFMRPIIFPEYHKKITRTTLWLGVGLLVGTPFLQWIVQTMIIVGAASAFDLPLDILLKHLEGGQQWGVLLVAFSLIYSATILWIQTTSINADRSRSFQVSQNVLRKDCARYQDFLKRFATGGNLEYFICHHNFGSSWRKNINDSLLDFVREWSAPEKSFQDKEIFKCFNDLLTNMQRLDALLAIHSSPLRANADLYGIIDPSIHNDWDLPETIDEIVSEANQIGIEIRDQRKAFILLAEQKFAGLPDSN